MEAYNMLNSGRTRPLAALAALTLLPAVASAADYTYIEGGFIDRHDYGQSGPGGRIAGSFDLPVLPLAIIAEYTGTDNLDQFDAGAIFHVPIIPTVNLFGGATLEHGDRNGDTSTGIGARAGVRWQTTGNLELAPELRYTHLFGSNETSVRLNALYNIAPHLALQGALQGGAEQRYEVGMRYSFGLPF